MRAHGGDPFVSLLLVGQERQPVVLVENFSPCADQLVDEAAALDFREMGEFYPGVRARVGPSYYDGVSSVLGPILCKAFGAGAMARFERALYSIATTPSPALSLAQRIPHFDSADAGGIAIIHYLSRADFGGTSFYRHRSTGFEAIDASREQAYFSALKSDFERTGEPPAAYIDGDTHLFERTASFGAAFNRALIYPSRVLHCASIPNGVELPPDPRTGRLTVASFLSIR